MITYEELHTQNHEITELSNVLLYLFKDRSMCDTAPTCELFFRYMGKVEGHINLVDRHLYGKLLEHENPDIQNLVRNFMSGSREIKRIMSEYFMEWSPVANKRMLSIAQHDRFLRETEQMSRLILQRIQDETEKLYPLIREISGNQKHIALEQDR